LTNIEQHIAQVEAKYQQGLSNWQANTGSFSLFAKSSHNYDYEANAPMEEESPQTSSEDVPTLVAQVDEAVPTPSPVFDSSDVKLPDVRKFHYLPSTAMLTKHRQVFKARQSEPLINEKNDQLWVGYISIGANQQSFLIDFDTWASFLLQYFLFHYSDVFSSQWFCGLMGAKHEVHYGRMQESQEI